EEILILVLGSSLIHLVLHFEHDGDEFCAALIGFAEDEVTLTAGPRVVVLLEVGIRERRHADRIELGKAVLLKALADHLSGLAGLEILVVFDLLVLHFDCALVLFLESLFSQFTFGGLTDKLTLKSDDLGVTVCYLLVFGL